MNRTVNFKAVAILTVMIAMSGVTVHFVHGYQVKRNSRELIEQASRAERDGQPTEAVQCLELYLGLIPGDIDAQARYALVLKNLAKNQQQKLRAFFVLEKVLRRDVDRDDVRRAAAELGLQFGRFDEVRGYVDTLRRRSPNDADLAMLHGQCELGLGNLDKATSDLVRATELAPQQIPLSIEAAGLLRSKKLDRPLIADEVVENLSRRGQPPQAAHEAAARYFTQHREMEKAERQLQLAISGTAVPTADLLLLAAEVTQLRSRSPEARQYLERGLSLYPKDARIIRLLAQVNLREGRRDEAKRLMATASQTIPERPEEIFLTADTLIELDLLDQASEHIAKLEAGKAVDAAPMLRGRLLMKKGSWGHARAELEKARNGVVAPALAKFLYVWLAECYEQLGSADQALIAYRQSSEFDRTWTPARMGLAVSLASTGQLEQAIEEYRNLLAQGIDVRSELGRLLLIRTQQLPANDRNYGEIERLLQSGPGTDQPAPELVSLQAEVLLAQGKPDDAKRLLETERDRDPTHYGTWLALANLARSVGPADADLTVLAEAEKRIGPRVEWELARARHWLQTSPAEASAQLKKLEPIAERYPAAEGVRLLSGLAGAYKALGDASSAQRLWRQIVDRAPDNLAARFALFEVAVQMGVDEEAEKNLGELRSIEGPNGPLAAYGEAARVIARAVRGDATALTAAGAPIAKAVELSPTWSRVLALQAQALELNGRPDQALEKYLEAIDHGDRRIGVVGRALQLLYQQRRYAEANALAGRLSNQALVDSNIGRLVAEVWAASAAENSADPTVARQRALDLARQSVKADTRDHRDYLWLAQVATLADQPAEAEESVRKALRMKPAAPEAWVMLVSLLAKTDPKKADAELDAARQSLPRDRVAAVLAPCLESLGRSKEAGEQYKAALLARPNDVDVLRGAANFLSRTGQSGQAVPLLRKLIDPGMRAPEETVAWARRTLALAVAVAGDFQQYREALALIDANGPGALLDRLAKAIILAAQPANRHDAIKMFESIERQQDVIPADVRFLLAQLYEADGQWNKARVYMLALVNEFDKNPNYVSRYIRGLLRHNGAEEAGKWVEKLSVLSPDSFEAAELKARVLKAQGRQAAEVAEPIRAYARRKDVRPELAAAMLDEFGAPGEAEILYQQFAASSPQPEATLLLAGFLARQKRLPEALALCERAWANCSAEAVAATCVAALRVGDSNAAQQRRVEQWIEVAINKNPQSTMLPIMMGMMYELCDRTNDADARYRQVLLQDPRNIVALNNLAYLLALRENKAAEALKLINQAIDLAGPNAELLDSRALIYLHAGQIGPALRDIQQAIVQVPIPSKTLNFRLAQVHFADKNRAAAVAAMSKAKELGLQVSDLALSERAAFTKLVHELNLPD
jgi:tetratricopeptide (TPR) repeat protein